MVFSLNIYSIGSIILLFLGVVLIYLAYRITIVYDAILVSTLFVNMYYINKQEIKEDNLENIDSANEEVKKT